MRFLVLFMVALICASRFSLAEEVPVDEFLEVYSPHAERVQTFYESCSATVLKSEMRYEVSGLDGQWLVEAYQPEAAESVFHVLKCPDGTIHLKKKKGQWVPTQGIFPANRQIPPGIGADEFLNVYCWNAVPLVKLLRDGWPFNKVLKDGDQYTLHWKYTNHDGSRSWGSIKLDGAHSFVCLETTGGIEVDEPPSRRKGRSTYTYDALDSDVPIVREEAFAIEQPDGSVYEGVVKIEVHPNQPADPERLTLAHYGISDKIWSSNVAPTPPWWESIPVWAILVLVGFAFFVAAAIVRRREARS